MLAGIASGPMSAASQSYLISSVGRTRLGIGGGVFFLSHSLGGSLGSFFTGMIKPTWNFQQIGIAMMTTTHGSSPDEILSLEMVVMASCGA